MPYNFDRSQNHYYFNNKNSVPIIFIHGLGLNQSMWKPQIDFFKNNSLITYDLLGHGKTPFSENILTMKKLASQLLVLIENLKIDKFHLIGFSIGALVSIEFATNYEKYLNSLTLISTTYKRSNDERQKVIDRVNLAKKNMPISQMAMKRWFSDDYLKKNPDLYHQYLSCSKLHWISDILPDEDTSITAKIRYRTIDSVCTIKFCTNEKNIVFFEVPQFAITPGQSIVFYSKNICLGGGIIESRWN